MHDYSQNSIDSIEKSHHRYGENRPHSIVINDYLFPMLQTSSRVVEKLQGALICQCSKI